MRKKPEEKNNRSFVASRENVKLQPIGKPNYHNKRRSSQ
jgi:hypothetical protein